MPADLARADQLLDLGRHLQAEEILRAYLTTDPSSAEALRMLALALLGQQRAGEAVSVAEAAVRAAPDDEHGHRLVSIGYLRLDRHSDAVVAAEAAVRLAPDLWQTHYTLGTALREGRRPRSRDALACANAAVRLAPHESAAHNLAGLCLDDLRMASEAAKAFEEALRLDPQSATAMNNVAATRMEEGKFAAASRMLTAGLSSNPQQTMLHQNYDRLLLSLVRRLYLALIGLGVLLALLAGNEAPYLVRLAAVITLLGIYVVVALRVTRHLPRGAHLWARGLIGRVDWLSRMLVIAFVLLTVAVVVMGVAPKDFALDTGLGALIVLRTLGIVFFIAWALSPVAGWLKRRSSRMKGPHD